MTNPRDKGNQSSGTSARGFASMPHEKVQEIASKGGHASAEKAGHEGMSERGQMGGRARAAQLGHEGYVELGHRGGSAPHDSRPGRSKSGSSGQDQNRQQTRSSSSSSSSGSSNRGFASMSKDKVRDIASKGGHSSHSGSSRSTSRDEEE